MNKIKKCLPLICFLPSYAYANDGGAAILMILLILIAGAFLCAALVESLLAIAFYKRTFLSAFKAFIIANSVTVIFLVLTIPSSWMGIGLLAPYLLQYYEYLPFVLSVIAVIMIIGLGLWIKIRIAHRYVPEQKKRQIALLFLISHPIAIFTTYKIFMMYLTHQEI